MPEPIDLSVRPTPEQIARFRSLAPAERYAWLASLLRMVHELAGPEAKARWRALKQAQSGGFLAVACAFARAIESADFDQAARCLSPRCTYESPDGIVSGVDAIVDSYRKSHDWSTRALGRIRHSSAVEGIAVGVALVTYSDRIEHHGRAHVYRCRQELTVGRTRLVEHIVHREIDEERRSLDEFLSTVGIERPGRGAR